MKMWYLKRYRTAKSNTQILKSSNTPFFIMHIICTVTNDLIYDQRMQRICTSLATHGYTVELVGRQLPASVPLISQPFGQKRLHCWFQQGFAFYAEYNLRLFTYLLFARYDAVCSIDLDTLAAGCLATLLRRKKRVFDAHEYFTEVPEVVHRRSVRAFWNLVARACLPFYKYAYTVGPGLAEKMGAQYKLEFAVVRNTPASPSLPVKGKSEEVVLYQGALNTGRGLEAAIAAMQLIDNVELWLVGEGDLSAELRRLAVELGVQDKVHFLGFVPPDDLKMRTAQAWVGLNLLENRGLSYYYSLANKFFDYVQAEVPTVTMNFPEYRALNAQYEVAILLDELSPATMADAIRRLREEEGLYARLQNNCMQARKVWNWAEDEKVLLEVWRKVALEL